jgi:sporulation protein YlmC with PRC-barrel domain
MEERMRAKHLTLTLLASIFISAPALAQTNPPAGTVQTMNPGNWLTQEQPGQWRASKLDGLNVYNNNNESIGEIKELLLDNTGKVQAVVIGVGGFLGVGEHDVAVPFEQIRFVAEPRAVATTAPADNRPVTTTSPTAPATPVNPNAPATTGTTGTVTTDRTVAERRAYPDHALLNMTKDQLKAAPEFKYTR